MADDTDKTEPATAKKLAKARADGDIGKSSDVPAWASLSATLSVLILAGGWMSRDLMRNLTPFIAHADAFNLTNGGAVEVMRRACLAAAPAMLTVMAVTAAAGISANIFQQGLMWAPAKIMPNLSKLSPMAGFKRMFGVDGLVQFGKSAVKVVIISWVCWSVLKPHADELEGLAAFDPAYMLPYTAKIFKALALAIMGVMGSAAAADWLWQRYRFAERMRMSREDIKEEGRQAEGDPMVKGKLRQMRMEKGRRRMMQNVAKATVVVTNPTHYAVALRYEPGETAAPECLAKGMDLLALKIRELAQQHDIPIIEDPPLARALYATVEVDQAIPQQHFEAVAKIIGFIFNASRKTARPAWL